MLLVQHAGTTRAATWSMLNRRWPEIMLGDVDNAEPSEWITVEDAAALARRRRAIEPVRIVIPAMVTATQERRWADQAMPMVF